MIRYAIVGAGWIAQEAFMPGVAAAGNASMQAIVSGNTEKAARLAAFYGVPEVVDYEGYDTLVASDRIDAVYIALPNDLHADYAIRALKHGKHVMVEKPLATSVAEGEAMIAAAHASGAYLMTAYRLHNEPGTHAMIQAIRSGRIGDPVYFASTFGFQTQLGNHRLLAGHWGGALPDVGVYCLNAARHVFAAEPIAVQAMASRPRNDPRFAEIDGSLAVTLRFPAERLAQFFCSFGSGETETIRVVGSSGELCLNPAFKFESALGMQLRAESETASASFAQVDHFAGQISYFSDCILRKLPPLPDGQEGLADLRVLLAIEHAAQTGETVHLDPMPFQASFAPDMRRHFAPTSRRLLI